ncbi:autotransporter domain-containing protein [Thioalkalivibrio sp. AKL12]|uniref:autotransporter domain-containing protein n=1 Tax=Thioalkalivibrio sp. AKL12 TaxID=1158159 RepID=UPI00035F0DDF|nr:autotransporter domain-containing protein [Thioalkalivibrio sp. AKL12]
MPVFRPTPLSHAVYRALRPRASARRHWTIPGLVAPAILAIGINGAGADQTEWTDGVAANFDWFQDGNWDQDAPDADTEALILDEDDRVQIADTGAEADGIQLLDGELEITTDGSLETHDDFRLQGTANLRVEGAVVTNARVDIGRWPSADAEAVISGGNAEWQHNSLNFNLGRAGGTGTLVLEDGARFEQGSGTTFMGNSADSNGTIRITDATLVGDSLLVGTSGTGTLEMDDEAIAEHWDADVGFHEGSSGSVEVDDAEWDITTYLAVGRGGHGELTIANGGEVTSGNTYLGFDATGHGTASVTDDDSSWTTSNLTAGWSGEGHLDIRNGGEVNSTNVLLGRLASGRGEATITDSGSRLTAQGALAVGDAGSGQIEVLDGGELVTEGMSHIAHGEDSDGFVRLRGPGSRWEAGDDIFVGETGEGALHIVDGARVEAGERVLVADESGSEGSVVIDGSDSMLEITGQGTESVLGIGIGGEGDLELSNGGEAESIVGGLGIEDGARGTATIRGNGSGWTVHDGLFIGFDGSADLAVRDGGRVTVGGESWIGHESGSHGEVSITGPDSILQTGDTLRIGRLGHGQLEILDGAQVESQSMASLAVHPGSSASGRVAGPDSTWEVGSLLRIGNSGTARLDIEDGATVTSDSGWIGFNDRGDGSVYVSGSDSEWIVSQSLRVGYNGRGHLEIAPDSEVSAGRRVIVADDPDARGTLVVNGTLASQDGLEVESGGQLGGDGQVHGDATIRGMLAPGNSIGSLTISNGDLTLDQDSVYRVEVNDGGNTAGVNNDYVTVEGDIHIDDSASVHVTAENGTDDGSTWDPETTYTILNAEQAVYGEFGDVTDDFAFLESELGYGSDQVYLTLTQVADFVDVARTRNQRAVAGGLDEQTQNADMSPVLDALIAMDEDNARAALDDLSGVDHTHVQQIGLRGAQRFRAGLTGRMPGPGDAQAPRETASLEQLAGLQLTSAGQPRGLLDDSPETSRGWWVNAEGGRGDIDDTRNASGADYRFSGLTVGFDAPVSEELHLGAAMGYTRNRGDTAGGDIDVDSVHLAGYGGWQRDALYARGSVGMAYHSTDTERFVDTVGRTAEADYSARGVGMRAEGGYTFEIGDTARLTPFGGLDYEYLRRSGFSESGAGAANLDVDRESEYSLRSQAGVRFDQAFETTGGRVAPYAEAAWVHEHGDRSSRMDTAFAADTSTRFTIEGPRLSRDRVRVAAGLDARLNEDSFLNVGYQGEIASSDDLHAIGLTFRRNW